MQDGPSHAHTYRLVDTLTFGGNMPTFADRKLTEIQMTVRGIQMITILLQKDSELVRGGYVSNARIVPEIRAQSL